VNENTANILSATGRTMIRARSERQAMDWSLVLASQGIDATIIAFPEQAKWGLEISENERERALDAIRSFRLENRGWHLTRTLSEGTELRFHAGAIFWCVLLGMIHWCSGVWPQIIDAGNMDSVRVRAGEWWRLLTAVTLHADLAHLMGNVTFGVIMLALAMPRFGFGITLLLTFLSGMLGNLAGLMLYPLPYLGVGASGMMMGALGLLAVHSAGLWRIHPRAFRLLWSSAGTGFLIFILFGMNPKTDVVAHAGGFLSGAVMGIAASRLRIVNAKPLWLNWTAAGLMAAMIGVTWMKALQHIH
jgi:rhomboid protease GluP